MQPNRHRTIAGALGLLAVVLIAFTSLFFFQGKTPGLYPERSWGPWRSETMDPWSTHVRINSWTHAAQAHIHYGKAEDIYLDAYGETRDATSFGTVFTLTPEGRLTAKKPSPSVQEGWSRSMHGEIGGGPVLLLPPERTGYRASPTHATSVRAEQTLAGLGPVALSSRERQLV
ncbi:hypothetical protein [Streptomyces goshikiensis]